MYGDLILVYVDPLRHSLSMLGFSETNAVSLHCDVVLNILNGTVFVLSFRNIEMLGLLTTKISEDL